MHISYLYAGHIMAGLLRHLLPVLARESLVYAQTQHFNIRHTHIKLKKIIKK
jgi:hypothetical protein